MGKDKFRLFFIFAILVFFFIVGCENTPKLDGKWKEIGKSATIEFSKDGTFKSVDNQKMAVNGEYFLSEQENIRFKISRPGPRSEILNGKYSVQGDTLTLISEDGEEIQRYRRQK